MNNFPARLAQVYLLLILAMSPIVAIYLVDQFLDNPFDVVVNNSLRVLFALLILIFLYRPDLIHRVKFLRALKIYQIRLMLTGIFLGIFASVSKGAHEYNYTVLATLVVVALCLIIVSKFCALLDNRP